MSRVRELWRDLGRSGRTGVLAGAVALLVVVPLSFAGPLARSALSGRAAALGLSSEVGEVRLGLRGLWLRNVTLTSPSPSRVMAHIDAVLVPLGGPIEVHGGRVSLRGSPDEIREAVRSKSAKGSGGGAARRELAVSGVDLAWSELGESHPATQYLWGLAFERTQTEDRARCDRASLGEKGVRVELRRAEATLGANQKLIGARIAELELAVEVGRGSSAAPAPPAGAVIPASATQASTAGPGWSGAVTAGRALLARTLADGAKLEVAALRARLGFGDEHLGFGPSRVTAGKDAREVSLAVLPSERPLAGSTPLSMGLRLPLAEGEPKLEIEGGPVALGALGVREGDLGLRRVREATLEAHLRVDFSPATGSLRGSGSGKLANLSLARQELSPKDSRGVGFAFRAAGEARLDGSRLVVDDAEIGIGDVRLAMSLSAERDETGLRLRSKGGVPLASCEAMLGSLPKVLVADLDGLSLEGTFALSYDLELASSEPEATRVSLEVKNDCRVKNAPVELSARRFRSVWTREVKGADGQSALIPSGPGAPEWVPYADISRYMEVAVLVCEDGGFYRHRGFDFRAIEKALKDDIRAGRFVRGASTISMQLAKNLYLGREKTLSRKIQEALLVLVLEQELSKQELMELYLNIVELGPGIYGVGAAADHYFNVPAKDLTLGQALYLASILPDPTRQHFNPDGSVTGRWTEYLRKLMRIARKVNRITDEELETSLLEEVGFRQAGSLPESVVETGQGELAPELRGIEPLPP